jgi:hypothetical protein
MRYGVIITGGPVHEQVEMARAAETAGWDGVFTWDGIHVGDAMEMHDPWVLMSAFAMATERVRIGAVVQSLARRRPWKFARETDGQPPSTTSASFGASTGSAPTSEPSRSRWVPMSTRPGPAPGMVRSSAVRLMTTVS